MTKQEFIERQIKRGREILAQIENMHLVRISHNNIEIYDNAEIERNRNDISQWQLTTRSIISRIYGENSQHTHDFVDSITEKNVGFNYKREFKREVDKGLQVLNSIFELMIFDIDNKEYGVEEKKPEKAPMVFISHSSKDKEFAESLVTLLEDMGLDSSNLFCSSVDGYGIGIGKDIFDTLLNLFSEHNLFVIFIQSPRYYKSAVSLNEMGAAWVLKTDSCSFLTSDMEFKKMEGVVNDSKISIKVNEDSTPARLTELKDKLTVFLGLPQVNNIKWERKRQDFINKVTSIEYEKDIVEEKEKDTIEFSNDELQIFSKWANNPIDTTFMARRVRGGLEVHFGYHNGYLYPPGESEAEFEDFMERLLKAGYIQQKGLSNNIPTYKITKQGYEFGKTIANVE